MQSSTYEIPIYSLDLHPRYSFWTRVHSLCGLHLQTTITTQKKNTKLMMNYDNEKYCFFFSFFLELAQNDFIIAQIIHPNNNKRSHLYTQYTHSQLMVMRTRGLCYPNVLTSSDHFVLHFTMLKPLHQVVRTYSSMCAGKPKFDSPSTFTFEFIYNSKIPRRGFE